MKQYGYSQETYRGFLIETRHEGEDGEVTGYTVTVDDERTAEIVGEEVGSQAGDCPTLAEARAFIDSELPSLTARTAHTPGPWKIDDAPDLPLGVIQDSADGYGICELEHWVDGTDLANARLIAAAPDLLAALDSLLHAYLVEFPTAPEDGDTEPEYVTDARAAIARATGQEG